MPATTQDNVMDLARPQDLSVSGSLNEGATVDPGVSTLA